MQRFFQLLMKRWNWIIAGIAVVLFVLFLLVLGPPPGPPTVPSSDPRPSPIIPTATRLPLATILAPSAVATTGPGAVTATIPPVDVAQPTLVPAPAFPGAEGFGAYTIGGRGGRVIEVTSLNDRGEGSLRACAEADGPRVCVFKVAGTIMLESELIIRNPYLTIAGQTAPGGGILLRNHPDGDITTTVQIRTHEVIIRYITIRSGSSRGDAGDALGIYNLDNRPVYNIVIDHSSFSWGVDEVFDTFRDVHDLSLQWNLFAEGLDCSTHEKGCHSKGVLLGSASGKGETGLGAYNLSFHHNLLANSGDRGPLVKTSGLVDLVNNVTYNGHGIFSIIDMESLSVSPVNYVNNYFKAGPETPPGAYGTKVDETKGGEGVALYVAGNISPSRTTENQPDTDFVDPRSAAFLVEERHQAAPVTTWPAAESYEQVLAGAGNNRGLDEYGRWYPRQDVIDRRVIVEVESGMGRVIDAPGVGSCPDSGTHPGHACIFLTAEDYARAGIHDARELLGEDGWPVIEPGQGYADGDHDGMPDAWEREQGFDPGYAGDGAEDRDRDGYTNLEEFLNGE